MKWVERKIVTPFSRDSRISKFPKSVSGNGINARGRLVEDEHFGFVDDGDRQREPLSYAKRQTFCESLGYCLEPEASQQLIDTLVRCLFRKIEKMRV